MFSNPRTGKPYGEVAKSLERALRRAGIATGDVTVHTLRHTALSRMIAAGIDDHTVMAISGHSTTRMLESYTHPTETLKLDALDSFNLSPMSTSRPQSPETTKGDVTDLKELLGDFGGRREARTRDLRVANAALSQLS